MTLFAAYEIFGRVKRNALLTASVALFALFVMLLVLSCSRGDRADNNKGRARALRMQQLRNLTPGGDVLPEMRLIVDSMRCDGKDVYYFAAMNVLIDQLFSRDLIGEADSMATRMIEEARSDDNRLALATAYRVKGQILFKVGRMDSVLQEFGRGRALIDEKPKELDEFSTAAAIDEWIWMAAREIGDTVAMHKAGLRYADEVRSQRVAGWADSTRHFEVTALAFRAAERLGRHDEKGARQLLDSASRLRLPALPVRAYEHWYAVRSDLDAAQGDYASAMALLDTIEEAHRYFPWFRLHDLHHKAEIAAQFGTPAQVAKAYGEYISLNDSLYAIHNEARFRDLTVLYHTELERGHRKLTVILTSTLTAIMLLLAVLLVISMRSAPRTPQK